MRKQAFDRKKNTLAILVAFLVVISITATVVSAAGENRERQQGGNQHGEHQQGEHQQSRYQQDEHRGHGEHGDVGHGEHGDWGWGHDYSHHHWWHGQYYPNCDWALDPYTNQWVWAC